MMIDKRLINTVEESKKWIIINVLWNWIALLASICSAFIFSKILQEAFEYSLAINNIIFYLFLLMTLLLIKILAGKKAINASYKASVHVKHKLRILIYQKLASMPLSVINQQSTSSIIQVASEGIEQLETYFGRYLPQLFYSILAPLTLFIFLSFFNIETAFILLICVPLIPFSIIIVNKIAKRLLAKYWTVYVGLGSSFLDNLQGLVTLKVYQDDIYKAKKMDVEAEHFRSITMKVLTMQLNSISLMDLLAYGGSVLGIIIALLQYRVNSLDTLGVILFILISSEFFIPLRLLGSFFHVAMNGKVASDKIFNLLDIKLGGDMKKTDFEIDDSVRIDIEDLSFSYIPEKPILNNLNISIEPKKLTVFVGKSGCGKSTLISLLMGFHNYVDGKILFNRKKQSELSFQSLYQTISLVSHNSYIFKGSVRDNMLVANPQATDEEIYSCLEQVNLSSFIKENGGLDMNLLSQGENISGGQIQRLALARALLHDSSIYIFDEATSNIDIESEEIILKLIQSLKREKTIIMVSHRLANAAIADKIYVLQDGYIVEQGTHQELVCIKGIYAEMFNQQMELEGLRRGELNEKK